MLPLPWMGAVSRVFLRAGRYGASPPSAMADDERIAEEVDRRKYEAELAARRDEVHAAIAEGGDAP